MLAVRLNCHQYEYDIHSLVKAFYPEQDVKVFVTGDREYVSDEEVPYLEIELKPDEIRILVWQEKKLFLEHTYPTEVELDYEHGLHRVEYKNELKQQIYLALQKITGKTLPWGTLTGIRPTKIAMTLLKEGKTPEEILQYMQKIYYVSREKGELSVEIAERENALLSGLHYEDGYSLYVGIPFCPTTCLYCSFTSYPICVWKNRVEEYLQALRKELEYVSESRKDQVLDTVYIGGGTPTTLEPEQLRWLLEMLRSLFDFSTVQEFTVEAGRADSITREKLQVLLDCGVTRISVNPQTMKEETLRVLGRKATAAQTKEAYRLAREVGFDNINMDLILGLPGETAEDVAATIEEVKKLDPDSLTVHSLAVKRASKLSRWIEENGITSLKNTDETMEIAAKGAAEMGLVPYYLYRQKNMAGNFENVGYARPGKFGIYNILIMEEVQTIIACGAGTVSKRVYPDGRIERCDTVKDVGLYMEKIDEMIERKKKLFAEE